GPSSVSSLEVKTGPSVGSPSSQFICTPSFQWLKYERSSSNRPSSCSSINDSISGTYRASPYGARPITLHSSPSLGKPRYCVMARYNRPSECGKNTRPSTRSPDPARRPHEVLTKSPKPSIAQTAESSKGLTKAALARWAG